MYKSEYIPIPLTFCDGSSRFSGGRVGLQLYKEIYVLERIDKLTGVGVFADIRASAHRFCKLSLIYADNGRGKSTLAAMLKSYAHNQPQLLINRRTIGLTKPQHAELLFTHGNRATFSAGQWNAQHEGVHVYDLDFVESSVYSGGEINASHRRRLLNFALGKAAVTAMTEFNCATETAASKTRLRKDAECNLTSHRGNVPLAAYLKLKATAGMEEEIASVQEQLRQAENIASIKARKAHAIFPRYAPDLDDLNSVLTSTHQELSSRAEETVREHLEHIDKANFRNWAHTGLGYIRNDKCPFCYQSLSGIELIDYYRECFNEEFRRLSTQVATLDDLKRRIMDVINLPLLRSRMEQAESTAVIWNDVSGTAVELADLAQAEADRDSLDNLLSSLIEQKKASPLTAPDAHLIVRGAELLNALNHHIERYNASAAAANERIEEYREHLSQVSVETLKVRLKALMAQQNRFSSEVCALVSAYHQAKDAEKQAQLERENCREALNGIMQQTLGQYETAINTLLDNFGARFQIREISYNYNGGGEPKSEYVIELRGERLSMNGEEASFNSSLSEGDKRTLAFAFFIAVVMNDPDLQHKIVVIDDPMCSLDRHRRTQTLNILKTIYDSSQQLIIMAHDVYFLKSLRDEFEKRKELQNVACMQVMHSGVDYSDFASLDVNRECESAYYSNHRMVSGYLSGEDYPARDVAIAIRPLLEGYLHRRYPGHVTPGLLFGEIVRKIADAAADSPLVHAGTLVQELNEINTYAGRFHHDTNSAANSEAIVPGELLAYSRRALSVIYGGRVS